MYALHVPHKLLTVYTSVDDLEFFLQIAKSFYHLENEMHCVLH